jgi:hypothetical protein
MRKGNSPQTQFNYPLMGKMLLVVAFQWVVRLYREILLLGGCDKEKGAMRGPSNLFIIAKILLLFNCLLVNYIIYATIGGIAFPTRNLISKEGV